MEEARPSWMPLHTGVVYGPVRSRRLGRSLGVNVLPPDVKLCTFNCLYCQYGWTRSARRSETTPVAWPTTADIVRAVAAALDELERTGASVDRITLAGHGEPTLHPDFPAIVDALCELRSERAPGAAVAVLSNSTTAAEPATRTALSRLDERYMKLDAGDQLTLRQVNACAVSVEHLVASLQALPSVVIQTMFVSDEQGRVGNTSVRAVAAWLEAVRSIRPDGVHLYTLDRAPAWPGFRPVPTAFLEEVAERVRAAGLRPLVFTR
jgi:wyosine [tRNA(Phe)-imidazoG37] synthetase (radical SAM superfamily)